MVCGKVGKKGQVIAAGVGHGKGVGATRSTGHKGKGRKNLHAREKCKAGKEVWGGR